jgi:hypothetical protein
MLAGDIEVGTTVTRRRDIHGGKGYEPRFGTRDSRRDPDDHPSPVRSGLG